MRQDIDESIEDWADRVQALGADAFRHIGTGYMNEEIIRRFCQGLSDQHVASTLAPLNIPTLSQAIQKAKLYKYSNKAIFGSSRKVRAVSFSSDTKTSTATDSNDVLKKEMLEMKELIAKLVKFNSDSAKAKEIKSNESSLQRKFNQYHSSAGSPRRKQSSPSRSNSPGSPRNIRCYNCNKLGHISRECPEKKVTTQSTSPLNLERSK